MLPVFPDDIEYVAPSDNFIVPDVQETVSMSVAEKTISVPPTFPGSGAAVTATLLAAVVVPVAPS
jgi:hypothetical protein